MNDLRAAAQQALEALEGGAESWRLIDSAITTLKAALAEPVQEPTVSSDCADSHQPVAWMHTNGVGHVYFRKKPQNKVFNPVPLYTAPPKRKPLAQSELLDLYDQHAMYQEEDPVTSGWWTFARAIERAHGIGGQDE